VPDVPSTEWLSANAGAAADTIKATMIARMPTTFTSFFSWLNVFLVIYYPPYTLKGSLARISHVVESFAPTVAPDAPVSRTVKVSAGSLSLSSMINTRITLEVSPGLKMIISVCATKSLPDVADPDCVL
jgi:hypothetical protein